MPAGGSSGIIPGMTPFSLLRRSSKRGVLFLAGAMLGIVLHAGAAVPPGLPIRAMTFNLRYASAKEPNSWPQRRPVMQACIEQVAPDVLGTQEGLYPQLQDLAGDLPAYDWIGLGRDGGSRGEFMAVFYRKTRFVPLAFDHFWLSDTPNVIGSATWGNRSRRMVTWVRFRERASGQEFLVFNTHLDNAHRVAREKGAALIRQRVQEVDTNNLPVLLLGDFNAQPDGERTHEILVEGGFFTDSWNSARVRRNEGLNTFHDFKGDRRGTFRIDWILTRGPWRCDEAEVVVFSRNGQFPSDHHPVVAQLQLQPGP